MSWLPKTHILSCWVLPVFDSDGLVVINGQGYSNDNGHNKYTGQNHKKQVPVLYSSLHEQYQQ